MSASQCCRPTNDEPAILESSSGNGGRELPHVKVEAGLYRRLTVLAEIGEAYLALEKHRADQTQCIQRINDLHQNLERLMVASPGGS